jgi:hypothetical protein
MLLSVLIVGKPIIGDAMDHSVTTVCDTPGSNAISFTRSDLGFQNAARSAYVSLLARAHRLAHNTALERHRSNIALAYLRAERQHWANTTAKSQGNLYACHDFPRPKAPTVEGESAGMDLQRNLDRTSRDIQIRMIYIPLTAARPPRASLFQQNRHRDE